MVELLVVVVALLRVVGVPGLHVVPVQPLLLPITLPVLPMVDRRPEVHRLGKLRRAIWRPSDWANLPTWHLDYVTHLCCVRLQFLGLILM